MICHILSSLDGKINGPFMGTGCGGGVVNWSFLQAGMVDELSLFLAPITDGSNGAASLFTQLPHFTEGKPVEFLLKEMEKIGNGGLRLNYQAKNRKV